MSGGWCQNYLDEFRSQQSKHYAPSL